MEALWDLEDKLKLSTQEAIIIFVCSALLVIGLCIATALKKKANKAQMNQLVNQEHSDNESHSRWGSVKRVLMGSVRWSGASKWEERSTISAKESPLPLLASARVEADDSYGWQSHNSVSPVWQRPILMGEKCELPRFSGLILYDENGQPIHSSIATIQQNGSSTDVKITLKDLLL